MNKVTKTILAAIALLFAVIFWVQSSTAKSVITVKELTSEGSSKYSLQLGARVTEGEIKYSVEPTPFLQFTVTDPGSKTGTEIPVEYRGIMPDTLRAGRDVILQGDYMDGKFVATSLVTQCPSKYEPPKIEE